MEISDMATFEINDVKPQKTHKDKFLSIFLFVYVTLLTGGFVYLAYRETALHKELAAFRKGFCSLRCPDGPQTWGAFIGSPEGSTMNTDVVEMMDSLNTTTLSARTWLIALEEKIRLIQVKTMELNMRVNNITLTAGRPGGDGKPGEQGTPGMPGEKGERGLTGQKGEEGSSSKMGPPGIQGPIGLPGKDGMKGETGKDGEKGAVGNPGLSGIPSVQGPKGSKGETGMNGVPGSPGINGEKGQKGEEGFPAQKGDEGSSAGRPGPAGPPGRDGVKGEAGRPGQDGEKGAAGSSGMSGNPGVQGAPGQKGSKGDNGAQGSPGIIGQKGQRGEEGLKGAMGQKGDVGSPGVNGFRGMKGEPGVRGPLGAKGDTGPPGPPGPPGTPGRSTLQDIVRIIGGKKGRVEVNHNGEWGTICDDSWDTNDGNVICRMMGYTRAVSTFTAEAGTGKIMLDDVACTGSEKSILDCTKSEWETHNCSHGEDAGVECI